jgi:hypothetical protein
VGKLTPFIPTAPGGLWEPRVQKETIAYGLRRFDTTYAIERNISCDCLPHAQNFCDHNKTHGV